MDDLQVFGAMCSVPLEGVAELSPAADERIAALYEVYRGKLYRFLAGQGIEPSKAQELTQEVFLRMIVVLRKGGKIKSEHAWLYSVASKLVVDYWRREGRPMWVELESVPALENSLCSRELTPEAETMRRQRVQRAAKALIGLPKEQRLGVHLRMQGLRYREIANILGVSIPTVCGMLSAAVERLRNAANE